MDGLHNLSETSFPQHLLHYVTSHDLTKRNKKDAERSVLFPRLPRSFPSPCPLSLSLPKDVSSSAFLLLLLCSTLFSPSSQFHGSTERISTSRAPPSTVSQRFTLPIPDVPPGGLQSSPLSLSVSLRLSLRVHVYACLYVGFVRNEDDDTSRHSSCLPLASMHCEFSSEGE